MSARRRSDEKPGLLAGARGALVAVAAFSALVNLLYLTGSLYMLQIYDRVIPSRSLPTLVALSAIAAVLYAGQGALDVLRSRVLVRIGRRIEERLGPRMFDIVRRAPLSGRAELGAQPARDLDAVRGFFAIGGPGHLFDLPWAPFYIFVCFLFHPLIGLIALGGAVLLGGLAAAAEVFTRGAMQEAAAQNALRNNLMDAARRNAEAVAALGMGARLRDMWDRVNARYLDGNDRASDVSGGFAGASKALRMMLQSAALGVGAYLVVKGEATGGVIIAGSILAARAMAPIEQVIAHYKSFVGARQSWRRLRDWMERDPQREDAFALPPPTQSLSVENLVVLPPGAQKAAVAGVSFQLSAGDGLGVIGPSASGKSSLARTLVGLWRPARGGVRLDGAALDQWGEEALGRHIGYLPQDIELFDGTIAQNIARFDPQARAQDVIAAAEQAGAHEMIVRLPQGYETPIGPGGHVLSGGQKQRVGLARALYGAPFLLVLDEPNSNLDAQGDRALTEAVLNFRARGGIAVVVAHRPSALEAVDLVLVLAQGEVKAFSPKDKALRPAPSNVERIDRRPERAAGERS